MFGYQNNELMLRRQRWEAQLTWPFLSESDLRSIYTEADLARLVGARRNLDGEPAKDEVAEWMVGYRDRLTRPIHHAAAEPTPPHRPYW